MTEHYVNIARHSRERSTTEHELKKSSKKLKKGVDKVKTM